MTERENYLRCAEFRGPEWIPVWVGLMPATWHRYREDLEELVLRHPVLFGAYRKGSVDFDHFAPGYAEGTCVDNWGCTWLNVAGGLEGIPVGHPLADYAALESYTPPDPLTQAERGPRPDWNQVAAYVEKARADGRLVVGGGDRFFERLHFLRGFEALMLDFAEGPPELDRLIQMVLDYNLALVHRWLEFRPDVMSFGDDLGTQEAAMVSPATFQKYLKPGYERMFGPCRDAGAHVRFHTDGHILELVDDLLDAGVTILNPQVRANTLEGLRSVCKGRVCIHLDLDRQLFPFASPAQIQEHIEEAVEVLGSPEGGLGLYAEVEPDVPLENIEAICCALEKVRYRYSRRMPAGEGGV